VSERERTYRVIQWATGSIGQISIRHFAENPCYELAGVYVTSDAKAGRDAGELADIPPLGVTATTSVDEVLALDADCVNYAPLYADTEVMAQILRSGKNIVTPVGFVYPKARDPKEIELLESACRDGGTSLHGAGIHPGFSGDLLPLTFARLCTRIDRIVVQEVADLAQHPSKEMMFDGLGFGRDPVEAVAEPSQIVATMERIFHESMALVAAGLGVDVDRFSTEFDVAVAKRPLQVRAGEIDEGRVAGMRFQWLAWAEEKPLVVFRTFWKMGDDLEPDWGYGSIKYSMTIEGEPSFRVGFEPTEPGPGGDTGYWGRVWTAMATVNAIPAVCAAEPGIRTHLDLPLIRPLNLVRPAPVSPGH
jgi:hypothetical protein